MRTRMAPQVVVLAPRWGEAQVSVHISPAETGETCCLTHRIPPYPSGCMLRLPALQVSFVPLQSRIGWCTAGSRLVDLCPFLESSSLLKCVCVWCFLSDFSQCSLYVGFWRCLPQCPKLSCFPQWTCFFRFLSIFSDPFDPLRLDDLGCRKFQMFWLEVSGQDGKPRKSRSWPQQNSTVSIPIRRDLKRPTFFSEAIIAAFPLFSLPAYFFLIIFFIIDKTDEFQLLFFILQVRGMQFLSDGFLQVAWFFEGCDVLWRPYLVVKRWYLIRVLCRVSQSVAWGVRLCTC